MYLKYNFSVKIFSIPFFVGVLALINIQVFSQNYNATLGSSYAGSMSASNNPAAILHVPFNWDITPFAIQQKQSTNAFYFTNLSLFSAKDAEAFFKGGDFKRFGFTTQDVHLFNTRIALGKKRAIAFGLNIRNYSFAKSSEFYATDTAQGFTNFLTDNLANKPLSGEFTSNGWAELFLTYSQIVWNNDYNMLNAGISVKLNRGLSGGYVRADNFNYVPVTTGSDIYHNSFTGLLQYGYSSNYDRLDSKLPDNNRVNDFLRTTQASLSFDFGLEYILKQDEDKEFNHDIYPYDWKFGLALMDVGFNRYKYGTRSRLAAGFNEGVTDTTLIKKFDGIDNLDQFNDSLATVAKVFQTKSGIFNMWQPMRLIFNVDKNIDDFFFINGQLTLPLMNLAGREYLYVNEINLITITPRWETKNLGVYLPIQYNTRNQFWVGGAFKAGPLMLGIHNWANLFSKNKMANGGAYLSLTIRGGGQRNRGEKSPKYMNCTK